MLNISAGPRLSKLPAFINGSPAVWDTLVAANPAFVNCVFSNNLQQAMVNEVCAPVVSNCLFIANSGAPIWFGGAVYNYKCRPDLLACQFINNSADSGAALAFDQKLQRHPSCAPVPGQHRQ